MYELKKKAIIVDVDGTIAHNDGHRKPFEWNKVNGDKPVVGVIKFIQEFIKHMIHVEIIYVSGRMDICSSETMVWIGENVSPIMDKLIMRKTGDYRSDVVVKREIYEDQIEPFYDVIGVFDDRNKVVKMWRDIGLTCFQVADGDF